MQGNRGGGRVRRVGLPAYPGSGRARTPGRVARICGRVRAYRMSGCPEWPRGSPTRRDPSEPDLAYAPVALSKPYPSTRLTDEKPMITGFCRAVRRRPPLGRNPTWRTRPRADERAIRASAAGLGPAVAAPAVWGPARCDWPLQDGTGAGPGQGAAPRPSAPRGAAPSRSRGRRAASRASTGGAGTDGQAELGYAGSRTRVRAEGAARDLRLSLR